MKDAQTFDLTGRHTNADEERRHARIIQRYSEGDTYPIWQVRAAGLLKKTKGGLLLYAEDTGHLVDCGRGGQK